MARYVGGGVTGLDAGKGVSPAGEVVSLVRSDDALYLKGG